MQLLKSQFETTQNIEVGKKLLKYTQRINNYYELYQVSLKLNQTNPNLSEPYLILEETLINLGYKKDAQLIKEGCKTCNENL